MDDWVSVSRDVVMAGFEICGQEDLGRLWER